jgi:hypothetical protein
MGLLGGRAARADRRAEPLSMAALLARTLRSPVELGGILLCVFVAAVLVSPLPPVFQPIAGLLLAAAPGVLLLGRVRRRLERERDGDGSDEPERPASG